jgi:hypothetical protein
MERLIASTSELVIGGHPYPDFRILLWGTMESCAPANQFFRYYLREHAHRQEESRLAPDPPIGIKRQPTPGRRHAREGGG